MHNTECPYELAKLRSGPFGFIESKRPSTNQRVQADAVKPGKRNTTRIAKIRVVDTITSCSVRQRSPLAKH
jgi:hypothetical protein